LRRVVLILVALVRRQGLLSFKPDEEPGRVFDYGETGFQVGSRTSNAQHRTKEIIPFDVPVYSGAP
jgi:hypothetical protein